MSGCEDRSFCKTFENKLKETYPNLTDEVIAVSDTLAPIALVCESGIYSIILFYFDINNTLHIYCVVHFRPRRNGFFE